MKDLSAKIANKQPESSQDGSETENLYRTNQELRKMIDKFETECKANTEVKFENARLRGTVGSKDSELRELQSRLEIMKSQSNAQNAPEKTQNIIAETLNSQISNLTKHNKDLQTLLEAYEREEFTITDLRSENSKLRSDLKRRRDEPSTKPDLLPDYQNLKSENEKFKKIILDKDCQLSTLTSRLNNEINTKVTNLENLLHDRDQKLLNLEKKFSSLSNYNQLEENYSA